MSVLREADTRAKLIDPAIHARGWTEVLIRREETAGAIDVIGGRGKRRSKGRTDYTLRVKVNAEAQPVAAALIEAKREGLPPGHGMEPGKAYADANFLTRHYAEEYFSHIIIEECHRSAWGKWSLVLTRNPSAVQVGLTATPRQLAIAEDSREAQADLQITADNIRYFGEPVYEYDMAQAIEEGYLAACEILQGRVNLDDTGITIDEIIARNPTDALTGRPVSADELRDRYEKTQYEDRILLPDRVLAMCQDLFQYLLDSGGPEQKTIIFIFCARDRHADDLAATMNNLCAEWCARNGRQRLDAYAFKCTAASSGNDQLADFHGGAWHHFIATTVDLLTTGVDVPWVRNIAFFKYVRSPIAFYQMIGRGTRIDTPSGRLLFRVYDYTNATRLFGQDFVTRPAKLRGEGPGPEQPKPPEPWEPTIVVKRFEVLVPLAGQSIVTQVDGRAMAVPIEEYKQRLAARLVAEAPSLDAFRLRWIDPQGRRSLIDTLVASGYSPSVVRMVDGIEDFDLFDVLAELGYGMAPRTRDERADAFSYKQRGWLSGLPQRTAATVEALAAQFSRGGTEGLENPHIFQTPEVVAAGGLGALKQASNPTDLLPETKRRMFAA